MKITKSQLQEIIREEMENLKNEGYMDALDRSREEERRQKRRDAEAREREKERNRSRGSRTGTPSAWGGGGIGGGGSGKKRFPGFNRKDEAVNEDTFDKEEEHDDEDKDHLEKIRSEINYHIDMLKHQRDRAEGRHEYREDD